MNKKIATLLVALMTMLPVSYAAASDTLKVGYVNTQRIFRDAPTAVKAAKVGRQLDIDCHLVDDLAGLAAGHGGAD